MKCFLMILLYMICVTTTDYREEKSKRSYLLSAEGKLRQHLMDTYESLNPWRDLRPLYDSHNRVNVSIGVSLKNLVRVDDETRAVTLHLWEVYEWTDEFLQWDPEHFDQHSRIELLSKDIWIPDIKMYQGFDPESNRINAEMVDVQSDGTVIFYPAFTRTVICDGHDVLECKLQYGTWIYDGNQVDVHFRLGIRNISLWEYAENPHYSLVSQNAQREVYDTPCCTYPHLTYWLKFQKSTGWW